MCIRIPYTPPTSLTWVLRSLGLHDRFDCRRGGGRRIYKFTREYTQNLFQGEAFRGQSKGLRESRPDLVHKTTEATSSHVCPYLNRCHNPRQNFDLHLGVGNKRYNISTLLPVVHTDGLKNTYSDTNYKETAWLTKVKITTILTT